MRQNLILLNFGVFLGSAIIIASPVQPVLQGMVGMIPVSVVGQNANTFSAPPQQVRFLNKKWCGDVFSNIVYN